jgi:3-dehydroquinate synthetase
VAAIERDAEALLARDPEPLVRAVRRSVAHKARVVARDERESGQRMLLNLGHTMGHAIEAARGLGGVRHGEAVALGMVGAFRVAARLGDQRAAGHEARLCRLLERLRLPIDVDARWDDKAAALVGVDKKRRGGRVSFIAPGAPGEARAVPLRPDDVRP